MKSALRNNDFNFTFNTSKGYVLMKFITLIFFCGTVSLIFMRSIGVTEVIVISLTTIGIILHFKDLLSIFLGNDTLKISSVGIWNKRIGLKKWNEIEYVKIDSLKFSRFYTSVYLLIFKKNVSQKIKINIIGIKDKDQLIDLINNLELRKINR